MNDVIATIEIKTVSTTPRDFYMLILGGRNGICATGSTIPSALRALADKITHEAEIAAVPTIVADAVERSMALERKG